MDSTHHSEMNTLHKGIQWLLLLFTAWDHSVEFNPGSPNNNTTHNLTTCHTHNNTCWLTCYTRLPQVCTHCHHYTCMWTASSFDSGGCACVTPLHLLHRNRRRKETLVHAYTESATLHRRAKVNIIFQCPLLPSA